MSAGTYRLTIGKAFYIGSSSDLKNRRGKHTWMLRAGCHPSKKLQTEFDRMAARVKLKRGLNFSWVHTGFLQQGADESDQSFRDRLRAAEQEKLDEVRGHPELANVSGNARGPETREDMVARWKDPEFRAFMSHVQKERLKNGVSPETREKMAAAKRGARNHKSRGVSVLGPDGLHEFGSASEAARFFKVSQQLFDLWLRGVVPWPNENSRARNCWIAAYRLVPADVVAFEV